MTLNERHYQQQISYKNTTIGLKLIEVNGNGGDGERRIREAIVCWLVFPGIHQDL